jgi:signal transduction histidine kinase
MDVSPLLLAVIPFVIAIAALTWYGARQTRTHAAMREHAKHQALVEHTDTGE